MKLVYRNPKELKEYENNPRQNEEAVTAVIESIKRYGFRSPILITANDEIVAGHTRKKAAIELEVKKVPCILIEDMDEKQIREFRLVDNKTSEFASWDMDKLIDELGEIANKDMSELFGFPDFGIDELDIHDEDFLQDTEIIKERKQKNIVKCPYCNKEFET